MTTALRGFYRPDSVFSHYIRMVDGVTEAPVQFHIATMLAVLGAYIGRRAAIPYGDKLVYPIVPVILVGPSGIGKGEALGIGRKLLRQLAADRLWLLGDEATPQALARVFVHHTNGEVRDDGLSTEVAIIAGEMATFLGRSGEKEGMVQVLTKLLEQDDSYIRTLARDVERGRTMNVDKPTLSFCAGTTIEWMRSMMPDELFSGGFFRRCSMVVEADKGQRLAWPETLPETKITRLARQWRATLNRINEDRKRPTMVDLEPSKAVWCTFKRRHDSMSIDDERLRGHYNSYPWHVLRTACAFAIACGRRVIEPQDIRDADAYCGSMVPSVRQVLLQAKAQGFEEQAQLLERIMVDRRKISRPHLRQLIRGPERQFDELVEWAKSTGMISAIKEKPPTYVYKGGRKGAWGR